MAVSLGYKDKITWETIQNPYVPDGMVRAAEDQKMYQRGQLEWAKAVELFNKKFGTSVTSNRSEENRNGSNQ